MIERLEGIGLRLDDAFEEGFNATLLYKEQFGDVNAPLKYKTPEGYKLGKWQNAQMEAYKKGTLAPNKIHRLEKIGFIWELYDAAFEKGIKFSLKYKEQFGDVNTPIKYKTPDGYNLGQWQYMQRAAYKNGALTEEGRKRLESIGLNLKLGDKNKIEKSFHSMLIDKTFKEEFQTASIYGTFDEGFQATLHYKEQFGNANTKISYKTPDGFELGYWQSRQRTLYKAKSLEIGKIKRLVEIGFRWNLHEAAFEKGFQSSLKYKEQFGNVNVPIEYKSSDGDNLRQWQIAQRVAYKKGKLAEDRVSRLEEIGFKWDFLFGLAFEEGIQLSLKYNEQFSDVNASIEYKTPDGYNLGQWQNAQRVAYKKGQLSVDRVKRLEEIGFRWDVNGGSLSGRGEGEV